MVYCLTSDFIVNVEGTEVDAGVEFNFVYLSSILVNLICSCSYSLSTTIFELPELVLKVQE